jgi:hypothetical protein
VETLFDVTEPRERLEPVMIEQVGQCFFEAKPCGRCGKPKSNRVHTPKKTATCVFQAKRGCARCGRNKGDVAHFGAPESFNYLAGRDPKVYRAKIEQWKALLFDLLAASDLPKGLTHVLVEGEVSFGDSRKGRDQGNHRVLVEKALGDALVTGGWLPDDTWDHYEFGGFARIEEPGVSAVRLMLFPT